MALRSSISSSGRETALQKSISRETSTTEKEGFSLSSRARRTESGMLGTTGLERGIGDASELRAVHSVLNVATERLVHRRLGDRGEVEGIDGDRVVLAEQHAEEGVVE